MWRALSFTLALSVLAPGAAFAQQPCTTDARRVVDELYRHMLERSADPGSNTWVLELESGRSTVRDVVRSIATSQEHRERFFRAEQGEATPYIRSIGTYYRHILARQPDDNGARNYAQGAARNGINAVVDSLLNSAEYNNQFGDWGVPGSGGIRFCAPGNTSTQSTPQSTPADDTRVTAADVRRFRAMDVNRDGVVSLTEWRGSRQSFRVHDWNGDNVLSGNEVRVGAFPPGQTVEDMDFDRAETFDNLDWNNNNRIDRAEWHGSDDAFDWLDRNNDNVLSRAELGANRAAVNNRGAVNRNEVGTTGSTIFVSATERWVDTGINVTAGDVIMFNTEGSVQLSDNRNDTANPGGSNTGRRAAEAPVPSAPAGGLIARIGNRAPVYVGDRRTVRAPASGRLYLSVNDDFLGDNTGEFRVTVDIQNR